MAFRYNGEIDARQIVETFLKNRGYSFHPLFTNDVRKTVETGIQTLIHGVNSEFSLLKELQQIFDKYIGANAHNLFSILGKGTWSNSSKISIFLILFSGPLVSLILLGL